MDAALLEAIGKWGLLPALAIFAISKLVPMVFGIRTDAAEASARTDVIELLTARVSKLEQAQEEAWAAFESERQKRMVAEDKVATLTRRVAALEDQIRRLGHTPE